MREIGDIATCIVMRLEQTRKKKPSGRENDKKLLPTDVQCSVTYRTKSFDIPF